MLEDLRRDALAAFHAALAAAAPARALAPAIADLALRPTRLLAIGKAASAMALACREGGIDAPGLIITNPENAVEVPGCQLIIGGHPVPDEGSLAGAQAAMELTRGLGADDHLLVLLSGGGSALMAGPAGELSLEDKISINKALLAGGFDIHEMNAVRRLFSSVKGGRLAALAMPARVTQWVLSDVPGDVLASIASGPFAPEPFALEDAVAITDRAGLMQHDWVRKVMDGLRDGRLAPPLNAANPAFAKVTTSILASNAICREAASTSLGKIQGSLPELSGDAMAMGRALAQLVQQSRGPIRASTGGETVMTLPAAPGLGGRSQALGLAFLVAMQETLQENGAAAMDWVLLAAGTDGRDGPTDAAGALVSSDMVIDPDAARAALDRFDSYPFLDQCGGLLRCPPTGTNLADIAVLIASPRG